MHRSVRMLATTAMLAVGSWVHADSFQFMNVNFEDGVIGNTVPTGPSLRRATAGNPIPTINALGGYNPAHFSPPSAASGSILVQTVAGSKAAVMRTNPTNHALGALWMDAGIGVTSQQVTLDFDISVLGQPATTTVQQKYLNQSTTEKVGILFGLNPFTSANGPAFMFAAAPTGENGGVLALRSSDNTRLISFGQYAVGDTNRVSLRANYDTGTVDAYLNGSLALAGHHFWNDGAAGVITDQFFMYLNGRSSTANSVAIDNVAAYNYVVPLPAAAWGGMVLLAGLAATKGLKRLGRREA